MSVQPKEKAPKLDPQLVNQLLSGRKTAGEIEDLLKDLRKAFIESAPDGELTLSLSKRLSFVLFIHLQTSSANC